MSAIFASIFKLVPVLSAPPRVKTEAQKDNKVQCNPPQTNEKRDAIQVCFMSDSYKIGDITLYKNSEIKKITRSDGSIKGFLAHTGVGCKNPEDLPNQCKDMAISNYGEDGKLSRVIPGSNTGTETAKSIAYDRLPNIPEDKAERNSTKQDKTKLVKTNSQGKENKNNYCDEPEQRAGKNIQRCYVQKTDAQGKHHITLITHEISPTGEIRQSLVKTGKDCANPKSIPGDEGACEVNAIGFYSKEGNLTRVVPGANSNVHDAQDILPKNMSEI